MILPLLFQISQLRFLVYEYSDKDNFYAKIHLNIVNMLFHVLQYEFSKLFTNFYKITLNIEYALL